MIVYAPSEYEIDVSKINPSRKKEKKNLFFKRSEYEIEIEKIVKEVREVEEVEEKVKKLIEE